MWVTKLLISAVKILPKKSPNLAQKWHFCTFWARPCRLIWLVVVARGLYLARHLFTLLEKTEVVKKKGEVEGLILFTQGKKTAKER